MIFKNQFEADLSTPRVDLAENEFLSQLAKIQVPF